VIEEEPPAARPSCSGRKLSVHTRFLDEEEKGLLEEECEGDAGYSRNACPKGSPVARDMSQTGMWRTCKTAEDDEERAEKKHEEGAEGDRVDGQHDDGSNHREDSVVSDASVQLAR